MKMIKAGLNDFDRITAFYRYVVDNTENMTTYCLWEYGLHPSDEMIKGYIEKGYLYYAEKEDEGGSEAGLIAAVAVTPFQGEEYHSAEWGSELEDDEVAVVHILCTDPKIQKRGLAKEVMHEVIETAKKEGKKAVRLDALYCNQPAIRLYESLGFNYCCTKKLYAKNTGWVDFLLFEYELK